MMDILSPSVLKVKVGPFFPTEDSSVFFPQSWQSVCEILRQTNAASPEDVFDGCQHVQISGSSIHSTLEGWRSYQAGDFAFKAVIIFVAAGIFAG